MKKILILLLLLISSNSFSQKKIESGIIIDSVSKIINKKVTFVGWYVENNAIKITQITIYDYHKKTYENLCIDDIKKYYPKLLDLFATKVQSPLSSSDRSYINNINSVYTINFKYWSYFTRSISTNC